MEIDRDRQMTEGAEQKTDRQTDRQRRERERDTCTVASFNVYFYYLNFNI